MLDPALASPGADFAVLPNILRRATATDVEPNLPTPVLQGAYTAMALTRLTMSNASSGLARQAPDAQRPNKLRSARLAP